MHGKTLHENDGSVNPPRGDEHSTQAERFLKTLFGSAESGFLSLWRKDTRASKHYALPAGLSSAADDALSIAGTCDVYYGTGLRGRDLGRRERGSAADVCAISSVWMDLDAAGPGRKRQDLPPTVEAALEFLQELELPASIIVHSGGGLHPYWVLREIWPFDRPEERAAAAAAVAGWQAYVRQRAQTHGWRLDSTFDLARVLRLPGTLNHKVVPPLPVSLLQENSHRYNLDDFAEYRDWVVPPGRKSAPPVRDGIAEGGRNNVLTSLGGSMRRRGMSDASIFAALLAENQARCRPPLGEEEVRRIAASVSRYEPGGNDEGLHLTELGNARRVAALAGDRLRHVPVWGWLGWDGRRWARTDVVGWDAVMDGVPRQIAEEVAACTDSQARQALAKWGIKSESYATQRNALEIASHLPGIRAEVAEFDRDPWSLTALNGVLDLRTGELRPHSRNDRSTKLAPVEYDPNATSPILTRFLTAVVGRDPLFAEYLQRAVGYSLTGITREEVFFLLLGPKSAGKTTLIEALLHLLGDYGVKADFETFLAGDRAAGSARGDLARLHGARLVVACEAPATKRLAAVLLKELVGGDTITARYLFHDEFSFRPQLKLWLAANDPPRVGDRDSALWRRLVRVPFDYEIPNPDPSIKEALCDPATEAARALFAWAVQGCLAWQREGLGTCPLVEARTGDLRREMDPLREFFEEACVFSPNGEAPAKALRAAYVAWASANGISGRGLVGNREWGERLRDRGCEEVRRRIGGARMRTWIGVGLRDDDDGREGGTDGTDEGVFPVTLARGGRMEKVMGITRLSVPSVPGPPDPATWPACPGCERRVPKVGPDGLCGDCGGDLHTEGGPDGTDGTDGGVIPQKSFAGGAVRGDVTESGGTGCTQGEMPPPGRRETARTCAMCSFLAGLRCTVAPSSRTMLPAAPACPRFRPADADGSRRLQEET